MLQRSTPRQPPPSLAVSTSALSLHDEAKQPTRRSRIESAHEIVVLGDKAVGKSALVVQLMTQRFIHEYDSSSDLFYETKLMVGDHVTNLGVWDSLQKDEREMSAFLERNRETHGVVLVYSVCDRQSFEHALTMKTTIDTWKSDRKSEIDIPVFLVGNKTDSNYDREVTTEEATVTAEKLAFHAFREVSALSGYEDAQCLFSDLIQHMRSSSAPHKQDGRRSKSLGPQKRYRLRSPSKADRSESPLPFQPSTRPKSNSMGNILAATGEKRMCQKSSKVEDVSSSSGDSRTLLHLLRSGINALRARSSPGESPRASTRPSPKSSPKPSPRASPRQSPRGSPSMSPKSSPKPSPYHSPRDSLVVPDAHCYSTSSDTAVSCGWDDVLVSNRTEADSLARHRLSPVPPDPQYRKTRTRHSVEV